MINSLDIESSHFLKLLEIIKILPKSNLIVHPRAERWQYRPECKPEITFYPLGNDHRLEKMLVPLVEVRTRKVHPEKLEPGFLKLMADMLKVRFRQPTRLLYKDSV